MLGKTPTNQDISVVEILNCWALEQVEIGLGPPAIYVRRVVLISYFLYIINKLDQLKESILICLVLALLTFFPSYFHFRQAHGILTENGICTNGNVTIHNQTQILNQSAGEYIKNLTTDNRLMAEIMCHALLNETTSKK